MVWWWSHGQPVARFQAVQLVAQLYIRLVIQQVVVVVVVVRIRKTQLALHYAALGCGKMALVMALHVVVRDYDRMVLAMACLRTNDSQLDVLHAVLASGSYMRVALVDTVVVAAEFAAMPGHEGIVGQHNTYLEPGNWVARRASAVAGEAPWSRT
jgi:hypothetical protein